MISKDLNILFEKLFDTCSKLFFQATCCNAVVWNTNNMEKSPYNNNWKKSVTFMVVLWTVSHRKLHQKSVADIIKLVIEFYIPNCLKHPKSWFIRNCQLPMEPKLWKQMWIARLGSIFSFHVIGTLLAVSILGHMAMSFYIDEHTQTLVSIISRVMKAHACSWTF